MATSSLRSEPSLVTVVGRRTSTHGSARVPSRQQIHTFTNAADPSAGPSPMVVGSEAQSVAATLRHIRSRKMHRLMMVASEKSRKLSADRRAPFRDIVLQRSFCLSLTNGYRQLASTNAITAR